MAIPESLLPPTVKQETHQYQQVSLQVHQQQLQQQQQLQLQQQLQQQLQLQQPLQQYQPLFEYPHLSCIPNLVGIPTSYEFEVGVPSDNNNIVFNQPKLYIKMNSKMTINVAYRPQIENEELYVRAMIILSNPAEMHAPVKRCANHRDAALINNTNLNILKINDPKALYCGRDDGEGETFGERLSVVVPLENLQKDQDGLITQNFSLEFACQNSCVSGINRKPTSIVFTLEKRDGKLIGKSAIEFKVCSCPKRDAERDQTGTKKRKSDTNGSFPRGKRPKMPTKPVVKEEPEESESDSTNEQNSQSDQNIADPFEMSSVSITLPTSMVPELLKQAFNMVAGKIAEDSKQKSQLMPCLIDLKKQRKELAKKSA